MYMLRNKTYACSATAEAMLDRVTRQAGHAAEDFSL